MRCVIAFLFGALVSVGCAHQNQLTASQRSEHCYTESGWLDSTNGCSARAGYPDCYLVCPEAGTRKRL